MAEPAKKEHKDAERQADFIVARFEKWALPRIAARLPRWVMPDHLTALGVAAATWIAFCYMKSNSNPDWLYGASLGIVLHWFGDSLDGTLARVRRHQRPRYGFYVDHVVDAAGAVFLLGGLGLSGYMSPVVALILLVAYLLVLVETFLATYTIGTFTMSYLKIGPTELRILLAIGNVVLLVHPRAGVFGREFLLFDVGGVVAACGMIATLVVTTASHVRVLYAAEPLPR